ncbi:MAG: L,D-transpeptidase family protein [Rhizomicrobium sp.]
MNLGVTPSGREAVLECAGRRYRAAVGRGGIGAKSREGDGITPLGRFAVRRILYRADRLVAPHTGLPLAALTPQDGWCDAPDDPAYNTQIRRPFAPSHEALWRDDPLYDLVAVLGFNDAPVVAGAGSAIFLHVARADYGATEGCIALVRDDLLAVLARLAPGDTLSVSP